MKTLQRVEHIVEGDDLAQVTVQILDDDEPGSGWGPYYSLSEMRKLEAVRSALREGDLAEAAKHARLFRLLPVTAA